MKTDYDFSPEEIHDPPRCECHLGGLDMDWDSDKEIWHCSKCDNEHEG